MKKIKLNQLQYKFWMDNLLKYPSVEYNTTNYTFIVNQNLSLSLLKRAYLQILLEYPPFSSVIELESDVPYFISDEKSCDIPLTVLEESPNCDLHKLISDFVHIPFNLQKEYPCRFYAIHVNDSYYLVHVFHHLVIDGISFPMFFKRLGEIYNSLLTNSYQLCSQDKDLELFNSVFERIYITQQESDISYWKEYVKNYPLSVSFHKLESDEVHTASFNFELGQDMHNALIQFKGKRITSLFRLYASVWAFTVAKSTNMDQLLVDHTLNMRPENNDSLLGVFVNNLPIRFDFHDGDLSMSNLFSILNKNMMDEKKHRYAFYHQIFHEISPEKKQIPGGINVSVSYKTGYSHMDLDLQGCDVTRYGHIDVPISNGLVLLIEDDDMSCSIRYGNEVSLSFVKSLSNVFQTVLRQVLINPSVRIRDLKLLSPEEQYLLVSKENNRINLAQLPNTFLSLFERMVDEHQDKVAVVYENRQLTFANLDSMSDLIANFLHSKGLIRRRIGLSTPKNLEMIITILGILKSANVYVPIDLNLPMERIRFMKEDCNMSMIIGTSEVCDKLESEIEVHSFEEILSENVTGKRVKVFPTDEAYIIYTSGTTGTPKAIPIQHSMLFQTIYNTENYLHLSSTSKVSQFASISFDASLIEIFPVLGFGGTLVLPNEREIKDPILFHEFLERNNITFAYIPPVFLSNMPTTFLPELKTIIVAGDSTLQATVQKWCKQYRLINAYGPTESTIGATYGLLHSDSMANDIGTPENGVTCYVLDQYLHMLPDNALGELYIGGVKLTTGYINRPELNKEKFIKNPFVSEKDVLAERNLYLYKTGDLVVRRGDGHLLFMGRSDFQVKLHGVRIELGEIETQISNYGHGITEVLVILHEEGINKQLVAYVRVDEIDSFSTADLRQFLRNHLPLYMVPSMIIPLKEFPCTMNGKLDRKQFPNPSLYNKVETNIDVDLTPTELKLSELWTKLLPGQIFGKEDDFKSIGGDSMAVIQMSFSIQKIFGVVVRATDIYRCSTLKNIADFIDTEAEKVATKSDKTLSPNQRCVWLHSVQSEIIKKSYNLLCFFPLPKETEIVRFERALNKLVEIQESFRMSFPLGVNRRPHVHIEPFIPFSVQLCNISSNELFNYLNKDKNFSFNLTDGPLYRVVLYCLDNRMLYCSLVMHQLISDQYSIKLIQSVILKYVLGETINWNDFSGSYLTYAYESNRFEKSQEYRQNLLYWTKRMVGVQDLRLFERKNVEEDDFKSSSISCVLPSEICNKVSQYCLSMSIPQNEFYCFIYLLLIANVTSQTDFVIGFPYEQHRKDAYHSIIGNFNCLLPLCFREQFKEILMLDYLKELHQQVIEGQKHIVALDDLLKTLRNENHVNQLQLIGSIFMFDECNPGLSEVSVDQTAFALEFHVLYSCEKVSCYAKYSKGYFSEKAIRHLLSDYIELINMIMTNSEKPLAEYNLLGSQFLGGPLTSDVLSKNREILLQKEPINERPNSVAEYMTLDIISRTLQVSNLGLNDNLLDFGINSMQVMEVVEEMSRVGITVSVANFYKQQTIRKILNNQESTLCYWGTPYDSHKPLILIIGGFAYYKYGYTALSNELKDKYSLLVIEAYYESFLYKEYSFNELLQSYVRMLKPVLKDKTLFGITGLCFGGEIGLQLAYMLDKEKIARPKVFVIDGYANRGEFEDNIYIDDPSVTAEVNKERNRISMILIKSFNFNIYKGESHICLADTFTSHFYQDIDVDSERCIAYRKAKSNFEQKACLWKKKMPHCQIHYLHSDHLHVYLEGPSREVGKIIDDSSDL